MKHNRKFLFCVLALVFLLACTQASEQQLSEKVKEKIQNATVGLKTEDSRIGSGFFIAPEKIVTNIHVIAGSKEVTVIGSENTKYYIEGVIGFNPEYDLVVLKVSSKGIPLSLSIGQISEQIFTAGYPKMEYQVKEGTIHSIRSDGKLRLTSKDFPSNKNSVFSPGISGGPVLNFKGEVVGIAVSAADDSVFSYAAPSDELKVLLSGSVQPLNEWQRAKAVRAYVSFVQGTSNLKLGILKDKEGAEKEAQELYDKIIKDCTNSIDWYPFASAYLMRGDVYIMKAKIEIGGEIEINSEKHKEVIGDLAKAIKDLTKVIKQFIPDDIKAYKNRGAANLFLGQLTTNQKAGIGYYNSAVSDYGKVITLDPYDAEAYFCRGAAHELIGQQEKSDEDFRRAKQLDPSIAK